MPVDLDLLKKITHGAIKIAEIDGMELVPHEIGFFKDRYLHPNDLGFMFMAKKLLEYIRKP